MSKSIFIRILILNFLTKFMSFSQFFIYGTQRPWQKAHLSGLASEFSEFSILIRFPLPENLEKCSRASDNVSGLEVMSRLLFHFS
jgi:hypothetical protein